MNKKIVISAMSILASLALMSGATFAFFSSSATSTGNVFSSGTLKLALCDANEPCPTPADATQNVTLTFGLTNMKPGDCTGNQTLTLKNTGSIDAGSVGITATNTNATMANFLRISAGTYDGGSFLPLTDSQPNTFSDLADLQASGLSSLSGINSGATKDLVMNVCLDDSADNSIQGQSDTLGLTVTLKQ